MKSYSATDVGQKRKINQDSIFASDKPVGNLPNLYIVADGMGGQNAGDFASKYTVNVICAYIKESKEQNPIKLIDGAIRLANKGLLEEASAHPELFGMGTTVVVTTVIEEYAYTANIGDSRLYLYDGELKQITKDHSLVEEMVRMGEITEEEARVHPDRHVITRAVGVTEDAEPDFFDFLLEPGAMILMCSDGLSNMIEDEDIRKILSKGGSLKKLTETLIGTANENGGKDNIAVILTKPDADEV